MLSRRWRTLLTGLVPVSALGVVLLGWWYAGTEDAGALDSAVDGELADRLGQHERFLWHLSSLGSPPALPLGVLLLAIAARRTGRRWPGIALAVAGPLVAVALAEFVVKPLVGRTLDGGLALPSGHTTTITSLAWVFVLLFAAGGRQPRWLGVGSVLVAGAAVCAVAGSMVAGSRHYATDTVAGALLATAVVGAVALLLDTWARRTPPVAPPATAG